MFVFVNDLQEEAESVCFRGRRRAVSDQPEHWEHQHAEARGRAGDHQSDRSGKEISKIKKIIVDNRKS